MIDMNTIDQMRRPSKSEQMMAIASLPAFSSILSGIHSEQTEIEIEETGERIKIPFRALAFLGDILKAMGEGKPVSIVPLATEVTTQKAAEILGCSRPYLVKLLEEGAIDFVKVGKHRRIKFEDVVSYRQKMKDQQKKNIIEIMGFDEELGLYDS
ncbi:MULTISPECIES: helix-turn-helix domain-containing protein [Pedobacter]|uniref:DNA binding domain-containing protein, excisionase family n=2 Tax=Pedobacter TaxID=84567 RepID=A0A1G6K1X2_9SPHI|nr:MULTISPECIES: helix-turn-helix domain-containing protein [Pedobacter]SDC24861.1 DNA binding domain-containing protein, excisionase family [Pedobacter soli]